MAEKLESLTRRYSSSRGSEVMNRLVFSQKAKMEMAEKKHFFQRSIVEKLGYFTYSPSECTRGFLWKIVSAQNSL